MKYVIALSTAFILTACANDGIPTCIQSGPYGSCLQWEKEGLTVTPNKEKS